MVCRIWICRSLPAINVDSRVDTNIACFVHISPAHLHIASCTLSTYAPSIMSSQKLSIQSYCGTLCSQQPKEKEVNDRDEKCQFEEDNGKPGQNNARYGEKAANKQTGRLPTAPLTPVRDAV